MSQAALGYSLEHTNFMCGFINYCIADCYRAHGMEMPADDTAGRMENFRVAAEYLESAVQCMKLLPPLQYVYDNLADVYFDHYSLLLSVRLDGDGSLALSSPEQDEGDAIEKLSECWKYKFLAGDEIATTDATRASNLMGLWKGKKQDDMTHLERELDSLDPGIRRMDVLRTLINFSTTTKREDLVNYREEYVGIRPWFTCCVCFQENKADQQLLFLLCGHAYHRQCLYPDAVFGKGNTFSLDKAFFCEKPKHCNVCQKVVYFSGGDFHISPHDPSMGVWRHEEGCVPILSYSL